MDTTLRDEVPPMVEDATEQPSSWVLRELRPVSYRLKEGPDSKSLRYGFVAQELDKVLPAVEEKFEKYFGYLARCEEKFCTTTLQN